MSSLEMLDDSFDIVSNCEHNVAVITGLIEGLHKEISDLTAEEYKLSIRAPDPPKTDVLDHKAWQYVVKVFQWCQEWTNGSISYGNDYSLVDEMGNSVAPVAIWIPFYSLSLGDVDGTSFEDRVNRNWQLVGDVFDQLNDNFKTMYQ